MTQFTRTNKQIEATKLQGTFAHTCLGGGSRSGKTFITVRNIIKRALHVKSRHLIARLRFAHVKTSIGLDTLPKVFEICFHGLTYALNKTDWYVELENGSQIWLTGTDDSDRVDKILGTEYSTIYFNEASQFTDFETISILMTRLAENSGLSLRAYYDCNPPTKKHWIHTVFIEGKQPAARDPILNWGNKYAYLSMNPVDNLDNLPTEYLETLEALPKKQRERFLLGLFGSDTEGALWTSEMIDLAHSLEIKSDVKRVVIGVDPAVSNNKNSDEWGIIVGALNTDHTATVLADLSVKASTDHAAQIVIDTYYEHNADAVIVEVNQGGDLVENVLRLKGFLGKIINVHASKGKFARAEPVSALYEQNKIKHVADGLEALESEMTQWIPHDSKMSPNRIDALVWTMFELYRLSEKPTVPVYRADYKAHKHIASTNLIAIKNRKIYIGWGLDTLPAVIICQKMGNGQIRVLDELVADEAGLRRFAVTKVRTLLKKKYRAHQFISAGNPAGIEKQKGSDNERAAFDVLHECGIPTEPAVDQGFEALTDNVRRVMQLSIANQSAMLIDPRCQILTDSLAHDYCYNERNKPSFIAVIEAHQYALIEIMRGNQTANKPIIQHKVIIDDDLGY